MALPALVGALGGLARAGAVGAEAAGAARTAGSLTSVATSLNQVGFAAQQVNTAGIALKGTFTGLLSPMTTAAGALGKMRDTVSALGNAVSEFVAKANPALVKQFTYAVDDLTASIGQTLMPVLQFAKEQVRAVADVFFTLAGPIKNLLSAALQPWSSVLRDLLAAMSPVVRITGQLINLFAAVVRPINQLISALATPVIFQFEVAATLLETALTPAIAALTAMAMVVGDLTKVVNEWMQGAVQRIRDFFGMKSIAGTSTGAAVRNVQMGSVESFQNKAITAAFGLGTSPEEKTSQDVHNIYMWLQNGLPTAISNGAKQSADLLWEHIQKLPWPGKETGQKVGQEVKKGIDQIGDIGKTAGRWIDDKRARAAGSIENALGITLPKL